MYQKGAAVRKEFLNVQKLEIAAVNLPVKDPACQHFCMARPTKYDLIVAGKKVAGAAQRQIKSGYLHQGSIAMVLPEWGYLERLFLAENKNVLAAMRRHAGALLSGATKKELAAARQQIKLLLVKHLKERLA